MTPVILTTILWCSEVSEKESAMTNTPLGNIVRLLAYATRVRHLVIGAKSLEWMPHLQRGIKLFDALASHHHTPFQNLQSLKLQFTWFYLALLIEQPKITWLQCLRNLNLKKLSIHISRGRYPPADVEASAHQLLMVIESAVYDLGSLEVFDIKYDFSLRETSLNIQISRLLVQMHNLRSLTLASRDNIAFSTDQLPGLRYLDLSWITSSHESHLLSFLLRFLIHPLKPSSSMFHFQGTYQKTSALS
jgi:hypothetical protein